MWYGKRPRYYEELYPYVTGEKLIAKKPWNSRKRIFAFHVYMWKNVLEGMQVKYGPTSVLMVKYRSTPFSQRNYTTYKGWTYRLLTKEDESFSFVLKEKIAPGRLIILPHVFLPLIVQKISEGIDYFDITDYYGENN